MSDINFVDDLPAATFQQLFVPACLPRSPNIHRGPNNGPDEIISLYSCDDCSEKFVFQSSFKFHKDRCSLEIKYNCRQCLRAFVFYNRCNFLTHLRQHNVELNDGGLSTLEVTTRPIPMNMMPYFTLTDYRKANDPKATYNTTHNTLVCSACPECKVNLSCSLKEHFNTPRESEKFLNACTYCRLILPTKCSLKAHSRIHTKSGTLICPECCISFPIWDAFWNHISNVCFHSHKILRYKCHKCSLIFKNCGMLHDHFLSYHVPDLMRLVHHSGKSELKNLKTCDLCGNAIPLWQLKSHVLAHSNDKAALNIVYHCPYASCCFSCEEFNRFKIHITSCLHRRTNLNKAATNSNNSLPNSQLKNTSETRNGSTKQALDILRSKGNIVVHKIESKTGHQAHQSSAASGGFRSVVRMPLTPSPEPLSEGSGQSHYNEDKQQTSHSTPKVDKKIPSPGESLLVPRLGNCSHELFHDGPVNEADVLVVKMHQCTICKELIVYDRKNDALKTHFKNVHRGKYKLGQIKLGETVDSETSASGSDLEDSPPLLKKQEPLAVTPRRFLNTNLKETAAGKEIERNNRKKLPIEDSDDECLLSVKNRVKELQSMGTVRTLFNDVAQIGTPPKMSTIQKKKPGTVENDLQSDSSSDSGPAYKRKRRHESSSDPDFECSKLFGYQPQLKGGHATQRRRRTLDRRSTTMTNQDRKAELVTPQKKHNGSIKKKRAIQESKQKSPQSHDLKAYYSDVVNEYKVMGTGIEVPKVDAQAKNDFQCLNPDCLYASNDSEAFRDHIKTHRTDDNTFQCMECGICFVVKTTFAKHLIINHTINDVDAYIKENDCCDKELIDLNINQLEKRLEKQKVESVPMVLMENQCKICYEVFADSLGLKKHFRIHGMAFLRMNQNERNK